MFLAIKVGFPFESYNPWINVVEFMVPVWLYVSECRSDRESIVSSPDIPGHCLVECIDPHGLPT